MKDLTGFANYAHNELVQVLMLQLNDVLGLSGLQCSRFPLIQTDVSSAMVHGSDYGQFSATATIDRIWKYKVSEAQLQRIITLLACGSSSM